VTIGSRTIKTATDGGSQPNLAPYYDATETNLGGGAIGLVPFKLHATDSDDSPFDSGATVH